MKLTKIFSVTDTALGGILVGLAIVGIFSICYFVSMGSIPSAIDIYRGKTTLEITYKDGVPTDSVVVYK